MVSSALRATPGTAPEYLFETAQFRLVQSVRHGGRRHGIETHAGVWRGDPIWRHAGEAIGGGLGDVEIAGTVERRDRVDGAAGRDLAETIVSVVGDVDVACGIHGQSPRAPPVSRRWQAWGMRILRRKRV